MMRFDKIIRICWLHHGIASICERIGDKSPSDAVNVVPTTTFQMNWVILVEIFLLRGAKKEYILTEDVMIDMVHLFM